MLWCHACGAMHVAVLRSGPCREARLWCTVLATTASGLPATAALRPVPAATGRLVLPSAGVLLFGRPRLARHWGGSPPRTLRAWHPLRVTMGMLWPLPGDG